MQLFRVQDRDLDWLVRQPESAMGLQLVVGPDGMRLFQVVGGEVIYDPGGPDESLNLPPWMFEGAPESREAGFRDWLGGLPTAEVTLREGAVIPLRFVINPAGPFLPPPSPPLMIFGHLPYAGTCGEGQVFYRWEPFPSSRRIDQVSGGILPGTFTAPASEVPFVASGFGAVGRFALPNLSPACWRWELRPPGGTIFRCGASVPLYGQSGGGVEAEFPAGFNNVGPIANPFILPAL